MADKEQDISNSPQAGAPAAEHGNQKLKRTVGNKVFDWGVYSSIAWIGVSALSLFIGHEAMYGSSKDFDWLRGIKNRVQGGLESGLRSTLMKRSPEEKLHQWGNGITIFSMLAIGGTILMAPIKWLEDNRQYLSSKIDAALGTTPKDGQKFKEEPKQTWGSVLSGRFTSVAISFGAFLLMGPQRAGDICQWFGKHTTELWMKFSKKSNPKTVKQWMNLAVFDILFTSITAAVTYGFSRFIAKKHHEKIDDQNVTMAPDPATPPPQTLLAEPEPRYSADISKVKRPEPALDKGYAAHTLSQKEQLSGAAMGV